MDNSIEGAHIRTPYNVQFSDHWSESRTKTRPHHPKALILGHFTGGPAFARISSPLYVLNGERLQGVVRTFNLLDARSIQQTSSNYQKTIRAAGVFWLLEVSLYVDKTINAP